MKNIHLTRILLLLSICSLHVKAHAQNTQVHITGVRSEKGKIILKIFKDQASFEKEQAFKTQSFDKKMIKNGELTVNIDLPTGTYGLTLLDDENSDGKLEKSFVGMPKEGFGFSNYFLQKMKKPTFDEFKTQIKSEGNKVHIKVKYM